MFEIFGNIPMFLNLSFISEGPGILVFYLFILRNLMDVNLLDFEI